MFLNAFSFEQEPHIIVVILFSPFGATDINIDCNRFGQSPPGKTPSAGRLINADKMVVLTLSYWYKTMKIYFSNDPVN